MVIEGYKTSAVGIIPDSWDAVRIGDITDVFSGGTPDTSVKEFWNGEIPWMNSGDLNKKYITSVDGRITEKGMSASSTHMIPEKCVLIGLAGQGKTRGIAAINYIPLCTNQSTAAIYPSRLFDPLFLMYVMESKYSELREMSSGEGIRGGLTKALIKSVYVQLPPKNEQVAIAEMIRDVDNLIISLQDVIEKKRNFMQSCIDQLYPRRSENVPKYRLLNTQEEWKQCTLGDIAVKVERKAEAESTAPIMMISASTGFIDQTEKYSVFHAGSSLKNYTLLRQGELAYNHGFSKLRNFGSCFDLRIAEARIPFVYHTFSLPDDDSRFFAYYLNSGVFDNDLRKLVTSTARMDGLLNISYEAYMSLKILRPSIQEQKAIGDFLEESENLINIYEQKLLKAKAVKQGMMEELLTGKVRLV